MQPDHFIILFEIPNAKVFYLYTRTPHTYKLFFLLANFFDGFENAASLKIRQTLTFIFGFLGGMNK